jgi:prepilin-type N-terminal cleavage/methylation domain-containing protein
MKQQSPADPECRESRAGVPPAIEQSPHAGGTPALHVARGFTLLELMVATAVASLLLVVLFSIIGDMMTGSRRTVQSLMASNSGSTAMDALAADLGGLVPMGRTNEYLFVTSETPSGGATNAYLRFLTQSPNNGTNAPTAGQPCFVAYRVAQYDSKTLETPGAANPAYALFRMTTNATDSFAKIGLPIDDSATTAAMDDFFANNVVEFSVQAMAGTNALSTNSLSLTGNSTSTANRPDALVITLVTLDETGAQRLRDGAQSLEQIKTKHGRVLTRRIQLTEAFMP